MTKSLKTCLLLGYVLILPFAARAAFLDVEYSHGFFTNPTDQTFATGLPLCENLALQLGFDIWTDIGSDGFTSLLGEDQADLFFGTDSLTLADYILPGEDSTGYAIYRPQPDNNGYSTAFYRYDDWENSTDVLISGQALWFRIDSANAEDGTPEISALLQLQDVNPTTEDPVAQAFYNELMDLTNHTGYLYLEGEFNENGFSWLSATLTPTAVPEPATIVTLLSVVALLTVWRFRRR